MGCKCLCILHSTNGVSTVIKQIGNYTEKDGGHPDNIRIVRILKLSPSCYRDSTPFVLTL